MNVGVTETPRPAIDSQNLGPSREGARPPSAFPTIASKSCQEGSPRARARGEKADFGHTRILRANESNLGETGISR
jgi:hypothetical protein